MFMLGTFRYDGMFAQRAETIQLGCKDDEYIAVLHRNQPERFVVFKHQVYKTPI